MIAQLRQTVTRYAMQAMHLCVRVCSRRSAINIQGDNDLQALMCVHFVWPACAKNWKRCRRETCPKCRKNANGHCTHTHTHTHSVCLVIFFALHIVVFTSNKEGQACMDAVTDSSLFDARQTTRATSRSRGQDRRGRTGLVQCGRPLSA